MTIVTIQPVIEILNELATSSKIHAKQIDEAIDALEDIKSTINIEDDEVIDKVDEVQDYLQYLLANKEPLLEEVKAELSQMINDLQGFSK